MTTFRARPVLGLLTAPLLLIGAPATADDGSGDRECTELVTHATASSEGDQHAVAITSQVLVADVEGWAAVSWEAEDGVEIDAVHVDGAEGPEVLEGARTGEVQGAHQLTFCGEVIDQELVGFASGPSETLSAGPLPADALPLFGAAVGGLLAGIVLLASRGDRRGRTPGTAA